MTDLPEDVTPRRTKRRPWATIITGALIGAILGIFAYQYAAQEEAFSEWPTTGTRQFADEQQLAPNAAIIVSCFTGILRVETVMLIDHPNIVSERVDMSEHNNPIESKECELRFTHNEADTAQLDNIRYESGLVIGGHKVADWTQITTVYSFDGKSTAKVRRFTHDIAVVLITFPDLPAGPVVLNGPNGLPAPSRDLLMS